MLFDMISKAYPSLAILPNDKKLLDGQEVDISIPQLNLAIEWNGIVHFHPLYGIDKLTKIQDRDAKKVLTANQKGIHLIVIPDLVSTKQYVIEAFHEIRKTIDTFLKREGGFEPSM